MSATHHDPAAGPASPAPSPPQGAWALGVGFLLLYALLPSRNFNYADDSLRWAFQLTQSHGLINSHHLYLGALRWLYQALRASHAELHPATLLALYSALCGALGLVALARLVRRAGAGRAATAAVAACAFSAGYWCYAIVGDVYVPATAFLLLGTDAFLAAWTAPDRRGAWRAGLWAATAFFLAVLHHQAHAVFVAGLVPATLLRREHGWARRLGCGVAIPAAVGLASLLAYLGAYHSVPRAPGLTFPRFLSGYVSDFDIRPDQKRLTLGSVANAAMGETRALLSTNVLYRAPGVARGIQARFPYRNVYPYPYLVRRMGLGRCLLVALGLAAAAGIGAWLLIRGLWVGCRRVAAVQMILVAAIPQMIFFMWWEGISDEFAIWTLPFLALVMACGAEAMGRTGRWLLRVVAGGLLVSTLLGSVLPFADPRNDVDAVNDGYLASLTPRDLVLGFDGIQSFHRISLARGRQGFAYFNVSYVAPGWSERDSMALEGEIRRALSLGGRVVVAPYLHRAPASYMVFLRMLNPRFDGTRAGLLRRLRALPPDQVLWVEPRAIVEGFFESEVAPVSER